MPISRNAILTSVVLAGAITAAPARAEYEIDAGVHVRYEDNIFRASQSAIDQGTFKASDVIYGAQGSLIVTAQPLDFDTQAVFSAGYDAYKNHSELNNFNYQGTIKSKKDNGNWGIEIDGTAQRTLSSFGDVEERIRNIQSYENIAPILSYSVANDIRIVATPALSVSTSSADLIKPYDYRQYGSGIGLGYYSPTGNSIAVTVSRRQTDGLHDNFLSINGVRENAKIDQTDTSVDLLLVYQPSTLTHIQGTLSYLSRKDKTGLAGNYHGPSGNLIAVYTPTTSLTFTLTAGRILSTQSYLFTSAVRTDYASLQGDLQLFDLTTLSGTVYYSHRRLRYDPFSETASTRLDDTTSLIGAVTQQIANRFNAKVSVGHDFRTSNLPGRGFRATYAMASLALVLGNRAPR